MEKELSSLLLALLLPLAFCQSSIADNATNIENRAAAQQGKIGKLSPARN